MLVFILLQRNLVIVGSLISNSHCIVYKSKITRKWGKVFRKKKLPVCCNNVQLFVFLWFHFSFFLSRDITFFKINACFYCSCVIFFWMLKTSKQIPKLTANISWKLNINLRQLGIETIKLKKHSKKKLYDAPFSM